MINVLSPVFKDIVIDRSSQKVSKNTTIFTDFSIDYGGVNKLQKNFKKRLDLSWFYVTLKGLIDLADDCFSIPKNASVVTAIIYLKGDLKETHIINMPLLSNNWNGPKLPGELLHVMYAEYFQNLEFSKLRKKFDILSADFCGLDNIFTSQSIIRFLSNFDYIFCSEHDGWANSIQKLKEISIKTNLLGARKPIFIFHTPRYVKVCNDGKVTTIKNFYFKPNGIGKVVGNGDLFAYLILRKIKSNLTFDELLKNIKTVQRDFLKYA